MSTLTVTTVTTANGTQDLTVSTGNTSAVKEVVYASGPLTFQNSTANVLYIAANGNIGIANQAPADALSVGGTVNATGFEIAGVSIGPYTSNVQAFTANGTWTKPSGINGNSIVEVMMWGGGGGGEARG